LFYPQMTLMTLIFWGVLCVETDRDAANAPTGHDIPAQGKRSAALGKAE